MHSLKWKLIVIGMALMMTLIVFSTIPVHVNNGISETPDSSSSETPQTEPSNELTDDLNPEQENDGSWTQTSTTPSAGQACHTQNDPAGEGTAGSSAEASPGHSGGINNEDPGQASSEDESGTTSESSSQTGGGGEPSSGTDSDTSTDPYRDTPFQFSPGNESTTYTNITPERFFTSIHLNSEGDLVGHCGNATTYLSGLYKLDPETGNVTLLSYMPDIWSAKIGANAIDNNLDRYYIMATTKWDKHNYRIYTYSSLNGSYIQNFSINKTYMDLVVNSNGDLIGFEENHTTDDLEMWAIDPDTGITTRMGACPDVHYLEIWAVTIDNNRDIAYQIAYPTYDPYNPRLYMFNSTNGSYIGNVSVDSFFYNIEINDEGTMFGIVVNKTTWRFDFRSLDPDTGVSTLLVNLTEMDFVAQYIRAVDWDNNIFYQAGSAYNTTRLFIIKFLQEPEEEPEPELDPEVEEIIEDIEDLIQDILDMDIHHGIENSLIKKLENAIKSLEKGNYEAALGKLNAFINECEAQRGKKLTEEQADYLIEMAEKIIEKIEALL